MKKATGKPAAFAAGQFVEEAAFRALEVVAQFMRGARAAWELAVRATREVDAEEDN